jgi:hypothetical protein
MTHLDLLGDRACVAVSWIGLLYILYWHLVA